MLRSSSITTRTALGEHHTIPQANPVALLFNYGPNVETDAYPLCGQRLTDRPTGVP